MQQIFILLHGAIGASHQLLPLSALLSNHYKVFTPNFSGHGGMPFRDSFSIQSFAEEILDFMKDNQVDKATIFGYSMGGYVGMYLLKHHPEKVSGLITLATKFYWDTATAAKETKMLDPVKITEKVPAFAQTLQQRHAPNDWTTVLKKTVDMMFELGENNLLTSEDYAHIQAPSLLLLGDRDSMVSLEETVTVFNALPDAGLGLLPSTPHAIEKVDYELLTMLIENFCAKNNITNN